MRIAVVYPPYNKNGRYPHLSQNRQVRYSKSSIVRIFPLIPASLVTILERNGHQPLLLDAINRRLQREGYEEELRSFAPDVIVLESKTPIMTRLWREVFCLKRAFPQAKIVLVGDHVSALPGETMRECPADYVVPGGDYDVGVARLVEAIARAESTPEGVLDRNMDAGALSPYYVEDLDSLPNVDREATRWREYGEAYLRMPAMYVLSGRGCGRRGAPHVGCAFCSWQHNLWSGTARLRSPASFVGEIVRLARNYRVREFFDDNESGGFWDEDWTREVCARLQAARLPSRVTISSNARADALSDDTCEILARSGFRLLKVGLESASDETLRRLGKGETVEEIRAGIKRAKDHGLKVLMTTMVGYPWETEEDARNTFELARELLTYKARLGDTLQCSVVVPYPGTPLYRQACENGWLGVRPRDYEMFDMDHDVILSRADTAYWCGRIWKLYLDQRYVFRLLTSVRDFRDFRMGLRGVASLVGHIGDYNGNGSSPWRQGAAGG